MRDVLGRSFAFDAPPRRVVSLVPSLTETLFALDAAGTLAGITDYCIFPPDLPLPRLGGTKNPRVEEIRALRPDLVYMNLEENLRRHGEALESFTRVFVTEPKGVDDVALLIEQLGVIHDRSEEAAQLIAELAAERAVLPLRRFTRLVESAGGVNVLAGQTRYPAVELADVLALRPDVVFLPDEPYVFTASDASEIDGPRVIGPFPGHLFTWHGVRTIDGLRFLRRELEEPESAWVPRRGGSA
jgi:ABC-type Fe3+-hydroxamate transport system substrate-binding protein